MVAGLLLPLPAWGATPSYILSPRQIPDTTAFSTNWLTSPDPNVARARLGLTGTGTNQNITFNPQQMGNDAGSNKVILPYALLTNMVLRGTNVARARGGTIDRSLEDRFAERINVLDYGVTADGVDCSVRLQAAYDALPSYGGTLYFPGGLYKFTNLTIIKNNVRLLGEANIKSPTNANFTSFVPLDPTRELITVGNDTGIVRGTRIENVSLYGGGTNYGNVGLKLGGGAVETTVDRVVIWNFRTNVWARAGSNAPCTQNRINNFGLQSPVTTNCVGLLMEWPTNAVNPTSYTTALFLRGGWFTGPNQPGSRAIIVDSTALFMSDIYCDWTVPYGILMGTNNPNGSLTPTIHMTNVKIDSQDVSQPILEIPTEIAVWGNWIRGNASINGRLKTKSGGLYDYPGGNIQPYRTELFQPWIQGSLCFGDFNLDHTVTDTRQLYAFSTNLFMENRVGALRISAADVLSMWATNTVTLASSNKIVFLSTNNMEFRPGGALDFYPGAGGAFAVHAGSVQLDNGRGLEIKDNGGVSDNLLTMTSGGAVILFAPSSGGNIFLWPRHNSGGIFLTSSNGTVQWHMDPTGRLLNDTGGKDIGQSGTRMGTLYATAVNLSGTLVLNGLTANRAVATDGGKGLVSSATTDIELGYVNGVTSGIQGQLNGKAPTADPSFTGTVTVNGRITQPAAAIGSTVIDWAAANTFTKTITGNTTFTFSSASAGQWITVKVTATGAFSTTFPTTTWQGGTTPTQTSGKTDFYTFFYDGSTYYGSAVQNF